ncbi:MAG: helix-turn-helix transcriptional regulator [Pseudomonadota bacterium]
MEHAIKHLSSTRHSDHDWGLQETHLSDWAAAWSPIAEMRALHPRGRDESNLLQSVIHKQLAGWRYASGSQLFEHGKRQIAASSNLISIQRIKSGSAAMEFPVKAYVHKPGMLVVIDHKQEFRGSQYQAFGEEIFIPRSLLGLEYEAPMAPILLAEDSLHGRLLLAEFELFFDLTADNPSALSFNPGPLLQLAGTVIGQNRYPRSERAGWWRARNELIRNYIDSNLGDVTLLPAQICNMFNLSRATLYRMFEADGGVRRYIQDRRLYSAVWDLAIHGTQRGRLTEVSEKWGFSSNANFNRAVKAAFGMPPGSLFKPQSLVIPSRLHDQPGVMPMFDWLIRVGAEDLEFG